MMRVDQIWNSMSRIGNACFTLSIVRFNHYYMDSDLQFAQPSAQHIYTESSNLTEEDFEITIGPLFSIYCKYAIHIHIHIHTCNYTMYVYHIYIHTSYEMSQK